MGILEKWFGRKTAPKEKVGGMEDYMTLVRVYLQAALAAKLGITNLNMLPDLRVFKQTLHVATVHNKLGVGEKSAAKKMMKNLYKTDEDFFDEIDQTIKKNCRNIQQVNPFLVQFQGFTQELMMLMGNLMKFKLRIPGIFKKTLYALTQKQVEDVFTKNSFKDPSVVKAVMAVRKYNLRLNFSQKWMTDFVYQVVMLAKKEPRPSKEQVKEAKAKMGK
ncbi:MAG: hypothetical protein LKH27_03130 [Prevotella sp.]|jgi:hypothetical protein|nr:MULTISPECIES: hypothetical protein [unclassified Prevotella]MCH3970434.1 hypothetical protein [Prevotella sp.]MCH3991053.1 hypothetical protein [Prevotella sp.]MCH4018191.1 hypothetical protein [Prevotella sp.]MCH4100509.1 hypothetical protein [Prevotella sp.]MCH4186543.1 hypothetical protein [Prevotella sp.]